VTNAQTEEEFLSKYNLKDYPSVGVTVDLSVFTIRDGELSILLIERGGHPEKGKWALPGGFVETTEDLFTAASRELEEEVGLTLDESYLEQLQTYGNPNRDKRGYIVSVAYVALVPHISGVTAGSDANNAHFFNVDEVLSDDFELAFDHRQIITDGLERVRAKIEYAPIAHHFLTDDVFTMSELRKVYETVWGVDLTPSNFRRKVQSVKGFVETVKASAKSNRQPALYKAGDAEVIYPPLQRGGIS